MTMAYIRNAYRVPAKRGGRVEYTGDAVPRQGVITSAAGSRLNIRLDGEPHAYRFHPTWELRIFDAPARTGGGGD